MSPKVSICITRDINISAYLISLQGYDREREERREERSQQERRDRDYDLPKKGNTIYVNGLGITEEILRKAFSNIGSILNINMERDKQLVFSLLWNG